LRYTLQWAMVALVLWGGLKLWLFTRHFLDKGPYVERAPLVDGFLPIGGLMGLRLWLQGGVLDAVHPAAVMILLAAILSSLLAKRAFCGWLCPIGPLSEGAFRLGARLLGRNLHMPAWLDYPLRGIKYLLLAFFIHAVFFRMPLEAVEGFLQGAYWKVADVKMLWFFLKMSTLTAGVLLALLALSMVFKNFWCRYLCPYGALLGLLSYLSPLKVRRSEEHCIHCGSCSRHCPNLLDVQHLRSVSSPECTGCLSCVSRCPAPGALDMGLPGGKTLRPLAFALLALLLFFAPIGWAKLADRWHSQVPYQEYRLLVPLAGRLEHPR